MVLRVLVCYGVALKHHQNESLQLRSQIPYSPLTAAQKRKNQESQRHAREKALQSQRELNQRLAASHYKVDAATQAILKRTLHPKPDSQPKPEPNIMPKHIQAFSAPNVSFASAPRSSSPEKEKGEETHWSPMFTKSHSKRSASTKSHSERGSSKKAKKEEDSSQLTKFFHDGFLRASRVVSKAQTAAQTAFKKSALPEWEANLEKTLQAKLEKIASDWFSWWSFEPTTEVKDDFPHPLDKNHRVAVAVTGHLRTFTLPGVYQALAKNVVQSAPGGPADVFLVAHTGKFAKSPRGEKFLTAFDSKDLVDEHSAALQAALSYRPLNIKYQLISDGSCKALKEAWKEDGFRDRHCHGTGLSNRAEGVFMQVMWMDHAFHKIRTSGTHYSVIVRSRPDVGIFSMLDWRNSIATDKISVMKKDSGGRADWFFSFPTHFLDTWWDKIAQKYRLGIKSLPDYYMFNHQIKFKLVGRTSFPAAIVRSPKEVECDRLKSDPTIKKECENAVTVGYFSRSRSRLGVGDY